MVENAAQETRTPAPSPSRRRPEDLLAETQAAIQAYIDDAIHHAFVAPR